MLVSCSVHFLFCAASIIPFFRLWPAVVKGNGRTMPSTTSKERCNQNLLFCDDWTDCAVPYWGSAPKSMWLSALCYSFKSSGSAIKYICIFPSYILVHFPFQLCFNSEISVDCWERCRADTGGCILFFHFNPRPMLIQNRRLQVGRNGYDSSSRSAIAILLLAIFNHPYILLQSPFCMTISSPWVCSPSYYAIPTSISESHVQIWKLNTSGINQNVEARTFSWFWGTWWHVERLSCLDWDSIHRHLTLMYVPYWSSSMVSLILTQSIHLLGVSWSSHIYLKPNSDSITVAIFTRRSSMSTRWW